MAPIQGGSLIRHARQRNRGGTMTCVVVSRDDPSRRYLLTAAHVIGLSGYARPGDAIEAMISEGNWAKVAEFETAIKLRDAAGVQQVCDAALARITDHSLVDDTVKGFGRPEGTASQLYEDMRLQFCGAGSGSVTDARVQSTGRTVPITYRDSIGGGVFTLSFANQVIYGRRDGNSWSTAAQGRDSGSLVLDASGLAVGMHIGRTPDDFDVAASVCTPIGIILDALNVMLPAEAKSLTLARAAPAPAPASSPIVPPGFPSATPPDSARSFPEVAAPAGASPAGTSAGTPAADSPTAAPPPASSLTSADVVSDRAFQLLGVTLRSLMEPHNDFGGVPWMLTRDGLVVDGRLDRSPGTPSTVTRVLQTFGALIAATASKHQVPVELIVATICTETSGRADAVRIEPGWTSDEETPHRVSSGLMQTLISTAREATGNRGLTRDTLTDPATSIDAGTAYIARQRTVTRFDPPQVACAYNAGGLYTNRGEANRWKLRQYPIGTGAHADRFTKWFNDCFACFAADLSFVPATAPSFFRLLSGG